MGQRGVCRWKGSPSPFKNKGGPAWKEGLWHAPFLGSLPSDLEKGEYILSCDHRKRTMPGRAATRENDELGPVHQTHLGGLQLHAPSHPVNYRDLGTEKQDSGSSFETPNM